MKPVTKSRLFRLLQAPLLVYVGFCGLVGACQRSLIGIDFRPNAPWWREVLDFLLCQSPRRLSPH